jgi:hypothetical protein
MTFVRCLVVTDFAFVHKSLVSVESPLLDTSGAIVWAKVCVWVDL